MHTLTPCRRDVEETLTPLGHTLASLPMAPQLGKVVVYGILLGCLDPALTLACSMAYRSPFLLPMNDAERGLVRCVRCVPVCSFYAHYLHPIVGCTSEVYAVQRCSQ